MKFVIFALAAAAFAVPANAEEIRNFKSLDIAVSGSIRQHCAMGIISSNGGIATDGMVRAVELGQPSGEAGLLAGDYSETMTVSPI